MLIGIPGGLVVKSLQFHAPLKEYFEITYANLRAKVEPSFAERSVVKHIDYFTKGRIVIAYVTGVIDTEVLTSDSEHSPYDYLVIVTGANENTYPISRSKRLNNIKNVHLNSAVCKHLCFGIVLWNLNFAKMKSAGLVLVIGGGSTGVELAGEIAVDFPEKKPTLVHKYARLLDFIGPKASCKALDWFISKNVNIILGETILADCHFYCAGIPWGMPWLKDCVLRDVVTYGGRVMFHSYVQTKSLAAVQRSQEESQVIWYISETYVPVMQNPHP
ncbi:hypothetical protein MKX01_032106 [Papaver californicum]|nr:hypothetical protein MKX01_032106 [Papaver californicum]